MKLKKYFPSAVILLVGLGITNVSLAQSSQYPMMDTITGVVIKKYQDSSCGALAAQKANPQKTKAEEAVIHHLKKDPKMRAEFINRVAGPIANRLFDCGQIP